MGKERKLEDSKISNLDVYRSIIEELYDLYKRKNSDYGDSFVNVRHKFPNAILIRLNDRLSRLETLLCKSERAVMDESIDDTLMDLAAYAIMELVERRKESH